MNPIFALAQADWLSLLPELVLTGVASVILLLEAFTPRLRPAFNGLALAGLVALWQEFAVGVLIIVAVALDQWIRRVSA